MDELKVGVNIIIFLFPTVEQFQEEANPTVPLEEQLKKLGLTEPQTQRLSEFLLAKEGIKVRSNYEIGLDIKPILFSGIERRHATNRRRIGTRKWWSCQQGNNFFEKEIEFCYYLYFHHNDSLIYVKCIATMSRLPSLGIYNKE